MFLERFPPSGFEAPWSRVRPLGGPPSLANVYRAHACSGSTDSPTAACSNAAVGYHRFPAGPSRGKETLAFCAPLSGGLHPANRTLRAGARPELRPRSGSAWPRSGPSPCQRCCPAFRRWLKPMKQSRWSSSVPGHPAAGGPECRAWSHGNAGLPSAGAPCVSSGRSTRVSTAQVLSLQLLDLLCPRPAGMSKIPPLASLIPPPWVSDFSHLLPLACIPRALSPRRSLQLLDHPAAIQVASDPEFPLLLIPRRKDCSVITNLLRRKLYSRLFLSSPI
jgi:hypothetical protein